MDVHLCIFDKTSIGHLFPDNLVNIKLTADQVKVKYSACLKMDLLHAFGY